MPASKAGGQQLGLRPSCERTALQEEVERHFGEPICVLLTRWDAEGLTLWEIADRCGGVDASTIWKWKRRCGLYRRRPSRPNLAPIAAALGGPTQ